MTVWDVLGIEYTQDVKKIREAYMERAKQVHPEEHPKEFQELQAAYKQAVRMAKNKESQPEEIYTGMYAKVQANTVNTEVRTDSKVQENAEGEEILSEEGALEECAEDSIRFDFSVVDKKDSLIESLSKDFFWKFKQLYTCAHTKESVAAWKLLIEDLRYEKLFEVPEFIRELSFVIGSMESVHKDVWMYMISYLDTYPYVDGCEKAVEYLKRKMQTEASIVFRENYLPEEMEVINHVVLVGQHAGLSKEQVLQMRYFVPRLYIVMRQREQVMERVDVQSTQINHRMEQMDWKVTVVIMLAVFVFAIIFLGMLM